MRTSTDLCKSCMLVVAVGRLLCGKADRGMPNARASATGNTFRAQD